MKSLAVIKHGNVFQYVVPCLVVLPLNTFLLQASKETLDHRIVVAVAPGTHAALNAVLVEQVAEVIAQDLYEIY